MPPYYRIVPLVNPLYYLTTERRKRIEKNREYRKNGYNSRVNYLLFTEERHKKQIKNANNYLLNLVFTGAHS